MNFESVKLDIIKQFSCSINVVFYKNSVLNERNINVLSTARRYERAVEKECVGQRITRKEIYWVAEYFELYITLQQHQEILS